MGVSRSSTRAAGTSSCSAPTASSSGRSGSTILDASRDWVLLRRRGELDERIVAVYQLVEGSAS